MSRGSRGRSEEAFVQVYDWDQISSSSAGARENHIENGDLAEELRIYELNHAEVTQSVGIQVGSSAVENQNVVQVSDGEDAGAGSEALHELEEAIFNEVGPPLHLRGCPDLTKKLEGVPIGQQFLKRDGPQRFCGYMETGRVLHAPGCHQLKRGLAFKTATACPACIYMNGAGDKLILDKDGQVHYDVDCQFVAKVWRPRGYKMILEVETRMLCKSCYAPIQDAD